MSKLIFCLIAVVSIWGGAAVPAIAGATASMDMPTQQELSMPVLEGRAARQYHRKAKKARKWQRRLQRWKDRFSEHCNCSGQEEGGRPDPEYNGGYDRETRLIATGVFLMAMGAAALIALFIMSSTAFIAAKIVAGIITIVGDALICSYANICILRTLYWVFGWF